MNKYDNKFIMKPFLPSHKLPMIVPALSVQQVVLIQADLENPYKISKMQHDNNNITCYIDNPNVTVLTVTIYTSQFFKIIIKLQENCYRSN
jgi:hypothetical protein